MKLTNFTINPSPFVRGQISKSFGQGINLNEEIKKDSFQIKDEYDKKVEQEELQKAHVKTYSKTTKSGKQVQVQEHEDKRMKHEENNKSKSLKILNSVSDKEDDFIENNKPNKSIKTGLDSSDGATKLDIYYTKDFTLVLGSGESENSDPFKFRGKINPEDVKKAYIKEINKYN